MVEEDCGEVVAVERLVGVGGGDTTVAEPVRSEAVCEVGGDAGLLVWVEGAVAVGGESSPARLGVAAGSAQGEEADEEQANEWIKDIRRKAAGGMSPATVKTTLAEYGQAVWALAMRGLEAKTMDPYSAGWRKLVVPSLGHIELRRLSNGVVDRAVHAWIADGVGKSSVKNALAVLVRVTEQAVRDGWFDTNPARVVGWQRQYKQIEAELQNPRLLALPDFATLQKLADALVVASADGRTKDKRTYAGWGEIVIFAACTAARIGEVSGVRIKDINTEHWIWNVVRQTTPSPGGLADKNPKSKRARQVPIMPQIRPMVLDRIAQADPDPDPMTRLFTGPRGGRISTATKAG